MPPPTSPRRGVYIRSGPLRQSAPSPEKSADTAHRGWPFAQGSQNHLDETSAPWPRPSSRSAPAKPRDSETPDQ